ncbi:MAG: hypothetical protein PW792_04820 [Acidobacteriaceae bacterium]|nr:hypothetical protein [Acidobacteriaceae bacterium]
MRIVGTFALFAALFAAPLAVAQQEGAVPTSALISIQTKHEMPVDTKALSLEVNGRKTAIESIQQVQPQQLEIAILIDDGLRRSIALQMPDIATFLKDLPPSVKVLVGYMQNGTVRTSGFSTDHEAVASQLRMTLSLPGISASPYFCLSDFVKNWPSQTRAARVVLMLTNGVDLYNGSTSLMNQNSPYVQQAQEDAQRAGAAVYSIYYGDSAIRGFRSAFSGSSYLQQVADATGGESLYQGTLTPPSILPYLKSFEKYMRETYVLSFPVEASRVRPNTLVYLKVRTSQSGTKVRAPDGVHPGSE